MTESKRTSVHDRETDNGTAAIGNTANFMQSGELTSLNLLSNTQVGESHNTRKPRIYPTKSTVVTRVKNKLIMGDKTDEVESSQQQLESIEQMAEKVAALSFENFERFAEKHDAQEKAAQQERIDS